MKKLFCTLALIAVICFSADAEISKTYCPKFETSSNLFLLFSNKGCSHLPEYSCKVSINMSANFGIGSIEGTCEEVELLLTLLKKHVTKLTRFYRYVPGWLQEWDSTEFVRLQ